MQTVQDSLFPIVLFVLYFYLFSRFFTNDSRNDSLPDPVVNLDMVDPRLNGDLPDVNVEKEDGGEDVNEDGSETQGNAQDNLEKMTVKELRSLASSYGLKIKSKAKKGEIIQMLRNVT